MSSRGESSVFKPSMGKKKAGSGKEGSSWGLSNAKGGEREREREASGRMTHG